MFQIKLYWEIYESMKNVTYTVGSYILQDTRYVRMFIYLLLVWRIERILQ